MLISPRNPMVAASLVKLCSPAPRSREMPKSISLTGVVDLPHRASPQESEEAIASPEVGAGCPRPSSRSEHRGKRLRVRAAPPSDLRRQPSYQCGTGSLAGGAFDGAVLALPDGPRHRARVGWSRAVSSGT